MSRISKIKILTVFLAVLFGSFSVAGDSYGQMEASSAETAQSSLPKPGNITVNFKEVDILTVLNYLSEASGVDIIPTPGVEGPVTMRLRDKPWEVALDIVTRNYGYAYSREADIIRVMPRDMLQTEDTVTEVIVLEHFFEKIELGEAGAGELAGVEVEREAEGVEQLVEAIEAILDETRREKVKFISDINSIIVTAIPAKISSIKELIAKIDRRRPQILLEAKVLRLVLDDDEQMGINWDAIITASGAKMPATIPFTNAGILDWLPGMQRRYYTTTALGQDVADFPPMATTAVVTPATASASSADGLFRYGTLDFSSFKAVLRMVSTRTGTTVISTPRITTLDNQKAVIKVVSKTMFQKTVQSTETANTITVEYEDVDEARETGTILTIVPHVNAKGEITVNLMPQVSGTLTASQITVNDAVTSVMTFSSREANTQVRVRDGETIFIGGLIDDQATETVDKLPILGDLFGNIPYVGKLFKYETEAVDKTEVVFFVTVHLVKDGMDAIGKSYTSDEYQKYWVDYHNKKETEQKKTEKKGKTPKVKKRVTENRRTRQPGAFRTLEEKSAS